MAVMGDRPYLCANFLVDLGDGASRQPSGGFSQVILPVFHIGPGPGNQPALPGSSSGSPPDPSRNLILRRGTCGALDLYEWWDQTRQGMAPPRPKVIIQLLGPDLRTVVLSWTFHQVRPVALSYTPLLAQQDEVVTESLELAFDKVEMA